MGIITGLLKGILDVSNQYYDEVHGEKKYTDKELRDRDLDDDQIKEVREGNQEPWDFEEENLEEDDYYYGDDE